MAHWVRRRPRRLPPKAARDTGRPEAGSTLMPLATVEAFVA